MTTRIMTHHIVQYSTVLYYCTVKYSTVQYSTVQYSTAQHCTAQHSTAQRGITGREGTCCRAISGKRLGGEGIFDSRVHGRDISALQENESVDGWMLLVNEWRVG